jgi:hypothetical protein
MVHLNTDILQISYTNHRFLRGKIVDKARWWYESLHNTFDSRWEVPHLPTPFQTGQGGLTRHL